MIRKETQKKLDELKELVESIYNETKKWVDKIKDKRNGKKNGDK